MHLYGVLLLRAKGNTVMEAHVGNEVYMCGSHTHYTFF